MLTVTPLMASSPLVQPIEMRYNKSCLAGSCQSVYRHSSYAGINHEWDLELYGRLLETGGGKERMTAYFTVGFCPSALLDFQQRLKPALQG